MKNILFIFIALIGLVYISNIITKKNLIPEDAIRIRVIANSNDKKDQQLKSDIKDDLEKYLYNELKNIKGVNNADKKIWEIIPNLKKVISKYTNNYELNYGLNYFPEKEYKGITYPEGEYKSLVVTLGNGLGNNWWCVLFPPLCLLEGKESDDVEYRSFVIDTINKYINN